LGTAVAKTVASRVRVSAREAAAEYEESAVLRRLLDLYGQLASGCMPASRDGKR